MRAFGRSRTLLVAASLVGALALAGCGGTTDKNVDDETAEVPAAVQSAADEAKEEELETAEADAAVSAGEIGAPATIALAAQTAESLVADSVAVEVEQEHRDSQLEVKLYTADGEAYKVVLAGDGKEVVREPEQKGSDDHSRAKHIERIGAVEVPMSEVLGLLEEQYPNAQVREIELDSDDGALIWEIKFVDDTGRKVEVEYDAVTGDFLRSDAHH